MYMCVPMAVLGTLEGSQNVPLKDKEGELHPFSVLTKRSNG